MMLFESRKVWLVAVAITVGVFFYRTAHACGGCDSGHQHKADSPKTQEPNKPQEQAEIVEQTTCPVMGGAINKEIFTTYKGKKVYFCCGGCKPKFESNPEKYIEKLPQFGKK